MMGLTSKLECTFYSYFRLVSNSVGRNSFIQLTGEKGEDPKFAVVLDDEEEKIRSCLRRWRRRQAALMPKVEFDADEDDLRDVKLMLPSDFSPPERSHHSIEDFADIEWRLREGEAYDVLELLRQQLN